MFQEKNRSIFSVTILHGHKANSSDFLSEVYIYKGFFLILNVYVGKVVIDLNLDISIRNSKWVSSNNGLLLNRSKVKAQACFL